MISHNPTHFPVPLEFRTVSRILRTEPAENQLALEPCSHHIAAMAHVLWSLLTRDASASPLSSPIASPDAADKPLCRKLWDDGFIVMDKPYILAVIPLITFILTMLFALFLLGTLPYATLSSLYQHAISAWNRVLIIPNFCWNETCLFRPYNPHL